MWPYVFRAGQCSCNSHCAKMWRVFNLQQWSFKVIIWSMTQWISHLVLRFQRFFFCWETFCPEPPSSSKASCFFGIYFDFSPIANLCRGTQTAPAALLIIKEKSWPICSGSVWGVGAPQQCQFNEASPPKKPILYQTQFGVGDRFSCPSPGPAAFFAFAKLIIITIISFVVSFFFFDIKNWLCQHTYTLISSFIALALPIWQ